MERKESKGRKRGIIGTEEKEEMKRDVNDRMHQKMKGKNRLGWR